MAGQLVIIPVFNEESTIGRVLDTLCQLYAGDILVIDDGSTDRSLEIAHNSRCARIEVLSHPKNEGYGSALIDGFSYAIEQRYPQVVTMDCDEQHLPQQVPEFFSALDRTDIVSGSRYLAASQSCGAAPVDRQRINRTITERINEITGYGITDAFCGFKGYRRSALEQLQLTERGYALPLQLWIQAYAKGLTVGELAVARLYPHTDRSFGPVLDDPELRLDYYEAVIKRELSRWQLT